MSEWAERELEDLAHAGAEAAAAAMTDGAPGSVAELAAPALAEAALEVLAQEAGELGRRLPARRRAQLAVPGTHRRVRRARLAGPVTRT